MQLSLKEAELLKKSFDQEVSRVSFQYVTERESLKISKAQIMTENEMLKSNIKALQKQISGWQGKLTKKESEYKQHLDHLQSQIKQLEEALSNQKSHESRFMDRIEVLTRKCSNAQNAYSDLEMEFTNAMNGINVNLLKCS